MIAVGNAALRAAYGARYGYGTSLTGGGVRNPSTGLGTGIDKLEGTFFSPTRFWWRTPLEILYVESGAARKFINIPVDDGFIRWRSWMDGDSEGAAETMEEAEKKHRVRQRLRQAMRAARAYGTAFIVLMTDETVPEEPLDPSRIRPGDLSAIRVFDRYDASVYQRDYDLHSPNFQPAGDVQRCTRPERGRSRCRCITPGSSGSTGSRP